MIKFDKINVPKEGKKIEVRDEKISVPDYLVFRYDYLPTNICWAEH